MQHLLPVRQPFSFARSLAFLRGFPPCAGDYLFTADSVTAAVSVDGRAWPFTLREVGGALVAETPDDAPALVATRAGELVGAEDDLGGLYAAAAGDPVFREVVRGLYGLHHVRFLTLAEVTAYSVMMQRAPIAMASRLRRKFVERFGRPVTFGDRTLRAWPELAEQAELDGDEIARAIGHKLKGPMIARVARGVAAIGEPFLRTAPYADAHAALIELPGIGPFSAAAILLRGLGRMDALPMASFVDVARRRYGKAFDEAAIVRRYGVHIGYWSYYLKVSATDDMTGGDGEARPRLLRAGEAALRTGRPLGARDVRA